MTARQLIVLRKLAELKKEFGWPPTITELARALGSNHTNGVRKSMNVLQREKYIERDSSNRRLISRAIRITDKGQKIIDGKV